MMQQDFPNIRNSPTHKFAIVIHGVTTGALVQNSLHIVELGKTSAKSS